MIKGERVPETVVLYKTLPDTRYLKRLQADGVARATMTFLPGACYAGAAIFRDHPAYVLDEQPQQSVTMSGPLPGGDCSITTPWNCTAGELLLLLPKLSNVDPMLHNAFVWVGVRAGFQRAWGEYVAERAPRGSDGVHVAAGHLVGCGVYNGLLEVLADDAERLLGLIVELTDFEGVEEVMVGRVDPRHAHGWGKASKRSAGPRARTRGA